MQNKTLIELLEEGSENLHLKPHPFFRSRKEVIHFCAEQVLEKYVEHSDFVEKTLSAPQRFTSLPYLSLCVEKTKFNIYGFIHGVAPERSYLNRLSWWNISHIREMTVKLHEPEKGRKVFLEENISKLLDLSRELEISDHTPEMRGAVFFPLGITGLNLRLCGLPVELLNNLMLLKHRQEKNSYEIALLNFFSLYSMYYQGKSGEVRINHPLKEPLHLELDHVAEATARSEMNTRISKRSLYTARKLLEFADQGKIPEVNYLGGLDHLTQIAYFLEHPDYSFKTLDDYIIGKG